MEIRQFSSCSPRFSKVGQGWARAGVRPREGGAWVEAGLCFPLNGLKTRRVVGLQWGGAEETEGSRVPGPRSQAGELLKG